MKDVSLGHPSLASSPAGHTNTALRFHKKSLWEVKIEETFHPSIWLLNINQHAHQLI